MDFGKVPGEIMFYIELKYGDASKESKSLKQCLCSKWSRYSRKERFDLTHALMYYLVTMMIDQELLHS